MNKQLTILFVLCSMLFFGCDLFTGPKVDLFQQISDEVDWVNAPKLSVRIDYPSAWGTSNPPQGSITPARDIRMGYEFSVEFIPDTAYTLQSWMVFLTAELDGLTDSGSWVENPELIKPENIQPLGSSEVTLPAVNASGGTFKFTILTAEAVTLVPWYGTQPRITRTEPRNRPEGAPYSRANDIVLYFNSALNAETVRFADAGTDDGIWITAKSADGTVKTNREGNWFYELEYITSGGFFTVTMGISANLPSANSLMTVTVKGIKNAQGEPMDEAGYKFSWNTSSAKDVYFKSWSAEYIHNENSNTGRIEIKYDPVGASGIKTYYRLNSGVAIDIIGDAILNVSGIDASGVRGGRQVSGIREYAIFVELYVEGIMENKTSMKVWNIPGMKVAHNNSVKEIRTSAELAAMKDNLGGQYVLANDITVTGDWMPVGRFDVDNPELSFTGKFYGNGHTITLNGGFGGELCRGLFGCEQSTSISQSAVIRDFTLEYKNPTPITPSYGHFTLEMEGQMISGEAIIIGGIAGFFIKTEVCNIITSGGTLAIEAPLSNDPFNAVILGSIAGMIEGEGRIENCRAALSTKYTSKGHTGDITIGAVAGQAAKNLFSKPDPGRSGLLLNGVTVAEDVISADKGLDSGRITIGGAFGSSQQTLLEDITFTAGKTVSFTRKSEDINHCGGIVGNLGQANMNGCTFSGIIKGNVDIISGGGDVYTRIGGLAGSNDDGAPNLNLSGDYSIQNCRVLGDIEFIGNGSAIEIGGLVGRANGIINNSYALGNVLLSDSGTLDTAATGGLVGNNDSAISNCFSAGLVSAQSKNHQAYSGGIAGYNNGTINYTAALGASVIARGGTTNNYALATMAVEEGAYNVTDPSIRPATSNASGRDGQDTNSSTFLGQSFWNTTLGFTSANWNFSQVGKNGYPQLKWE